MKELIQKIRVLLPAIAFVGGFTWDSFTLGKIVKSSDLLILLAYYLVALVFLLLLSSSSLAFELQNEKRSLYKRLHAFALERDYGDSWRYRFSYVVQFCFGSLYSALVVFYFKSSGSLGSLFFVVILAVLLVLNEFLQKHYESFGLSLAFFSLLGAMFFNFLIPHLVDGIGFFWFLISLLLSYGICFLTWKVSGKSSKKNLVASSIISLFLLFAYLLNWISPVPFVLKEQMPCLEFSKDYSCKISSPGFLERHALRAPIVYRTPEDGGVFFLSSVFAPEKISANLEHRWYLKNPETGTFELKDKISSAKMKTRGSREEGFRIYTQKKNVPEGRWKVETAVKDGAVIGSKQFVVKNVQERPERIIWKMN